MAVGYHKINTSAARAKRSGRSARDRQSRAPIVTMAGTAFHDPTYGICKTLEDFVSDSDSVMVATQSGQITVKGGWVRANINHCNRG